jgi:hypothetical protein
MDDVKVDRLEELLRHLQVLIDNPETSIDAKLFDDVELQLTSKLHFPPFSDNGPSGLRSLI